MAEEEQEATEEQTEGLQLTPPEAQPKGDNKMLLIVIAVVVLLIIIISSVLFNLFFSDADETKIKGSDEEAEFVEQYNRRMQYTLEPSNMPLYSKPLSYTTNMKNGLNYIHIMIRVMVYDPMAITFLEGRMPLIDDKLINLLKTKQPQEIKTRTGLEILKQELFIEFNKMFPQEFIDLSESKDRMPVKDILIVEFFIQ